MGWQSERGAVFVVALLFILVVGMTMASAAESWQALMQREREEELLFRGGQLRNALTRWHQPRAGQHPRTRLNDLKELLKDPRTPGTVRYLRRLYNDPITGGDWQLIKDSTWGIIGVASTSTDTPRKQANFPPEFEEFEGRARYSDWQFVYRPQGAAAKQAPIIRK